MANTLQAKKRARQAEKRRLQNAGLRNKLRTFLKKVIAAVDTRNKSAAQEAFKVAQPVIDSMVTKGIIHKNKAARHKSRLSARIKAISA